MNTGAAGLFQFRRPRQETAQPQMVLLLVPKENELGACLPVQRALSSALHTRAVLVEKDIRGSMERGWSFRRDFEQGMFNGGNEAITIAGNDVLVIEDALVRTREIGSFLRTCDSSGLVLELHAMAEEEHAEIPVRQIRGTDFGIGSFFEIFSFIMAEQFSHITDVMRNIARMRGLSIEEAKREIEAWKNEFRPRRKSMKCLEIPSKWVPLADGHYMYGHYYGKNSQPIDRDITYYEGSYCAGTRESVGFTENEIRKIVSLVFIKNRV